MSEERDRGWLVPGAGEGRGDAASTRDSAGDGTEATRVFTRSASGVPQDGAEDTRRFPRGDRSADAEPRVSGGPDTADADDAYGPQSADATQVIRRSGGPSGDGTDRPDGPDGPWGRGPRGDAPAPRPRRRRRVRLRWIVALVLLLVLAAPPATWVWVWYTARADERPASDAILVLGASQYNGRPSPIFEARLAHAENLYRAGVAPAVVTVGGNQPGDNYTEGGSGRDWLVEQGVPAADVVAVEEGDDTLKSIEAVSEVFENRDWSSVVIVTDPWHSLRSREMAGDHGMEAATSPSRSGPAVIERETQLWYITRETASLWYYWIFGDSSDIEVDAA
ncbi:YdcF family protein [Streptomonospora wellingtoniae]|uniref:ElyC/SanA/YdcF family protein n=1 Tax=Streptomonospora wellingtoniae TaxID=3075544 RepID=A0ABU2KS81_9ACTN|nr:ElyC/SanA/YdcF family protein [Streptomonospora sp. DSM 45055]MDT0302081.1 ElyC/SanA/YdcF family protein [Streptomonospora sp. DSM 45055]